jgi:hypothetical protein
VRVVVAGREEVGAGERLAQVEPIVGHLRKFFGQLL